MGVFLNSNWSSYPITEAILCGISEEILYKEFGLSSTDFCLGRTKLPVETIDRIMTVVPKLIDRPNLFLDAAKNPILMRIAPLDKLVFASVNGEQALTGVKKYSHLIHPYARFQTEIESSRFSIRLVPVNEKACKPHYAELFLGSILTFLGRLTGRMPDPLLTTFNYPEPVHSHCYPAIFGHRIRFGAKYTALNLSMDDMRLPFLSANERQKMRATEEVDQLIRTQSPTSFAHQISNILWTRTDKNSLTLQSAAVRFSLTPRTLQRNLDAEGTSFKELKNNVLCRKATWLLTHTTFPVQKISDSLGFSEISAFYHAFRRWTNKTPNEYRQCHIPN